MRKVEKFIISLLVPTDDEELRPEGKLKINVTVFWTIAHTEYGRGINSATSINLGVDNVLH